MTNTVARRTRAYAPASIGNVSLGFDLLGAALAPINGELLGDWVEAIDASQFSLSCDGAFAHKLPDDTGQNIVSQCHDYFQIQLKNHGLQPLQVAMHLHKSLPIGSGLGSSASSIVAAFYALNEHAGQPFNEDKLLLMMGELEGQISGSIHYDNVAPSYLGGMTLMTGEDSPIALRLPSFDQWYYVICYSGITVSTAKAREILPKQVELADTLNFGRQLAVFTHALHTGNQDLAGKMMQDVIAEPYRKSLLPRFDDARAYCMKNDALAFGISGSGPTVFALTTELSKAELMQAWLLAEYKQNQDGFAHICKLDNLGTRLLNTDK